MACLQGEVQMACPVPDRLIGALPSMTVLRWRAREAEWLSRWSIRDSNAIDPELPEAANMAGGFAAVAAAQQSACGGLLKPRAAIG